MAKQQKADKQSKPEKTPTLYKLLGPAMAIPTGIVVKKIADGAWLKVRGYPPPKNPAGRGVTVGDAVAWAAVSGALVGVGRMAAARGAAKVYESLTGNVPPGVNDESAG